MYIVFRDLILQDESCVTCDHLLLGKFVFSWMENNIPLFVFVVAFFFFLGFQQVVLHKWIYTGLSGVEERWRGKTHSLYPHLCTW